MCIWDAAALDPSSGGYISSSSLYPSPFYFQPTDNSPPLLLLSSPCDLQIEHPLCFAAGAPVLWNLAHPSMPLPLVTHIMASAPH